jgi:hypothetical protein
MNNKFIVTFNDFNDSSRALTDTVTLGDSSTSGALSVSAQNTVSQHPFNHLDPLILNPYATFFTLALPTQGWSNRLKKHDPTTEEQSDYFENTFNNIVFKNHNPFQFMYSLEYNEDMANIHAHGVIHECHTHKELTLFKKELRKIFKIAPANRIAIKYYKTDELYLMRKYHYHLSNYDFKKQEYKNKVKTYYTSVKR